MVFHLTVMGLNIVLKSLSASALLAFYWANRKALREVSALEVNLVNICAKKTVQMASDTEG